MKSTSLVAFFLLACTLFVLGYCPPALSRYATPDGKRTVTDVLREIGPRPEARIKHLFENAGVSYPPSSITLIGLKDELELEVWAEKDNRWVHVTTYEVYGASGGLGPKRKAGDGQVPEGVYGITELNPNSRFHLSMRIDYPNGFDRMMAQSEKRSNLGGDIYLHGKTKSKGCLAVGDRAIEELFVLAAKTGIGNVKVVIVPFDFRRQTFHSAVRVAPAWISELYEKLGRELAKYRQVEAL